MFSVKILALDCTIDLNDLSGQLDVIKADLIKSGKIYQ